MISLRLPPDLIRRLDAWRDAQDFPPLRTAVVVKALEEFLAAREKPENGKLDQKQ